MHIVRYRIYWYDDGFLSTFLHDTILISISLATKCLFRIRFPLNLNKNDAIFFFSCRFFRILVISVIFILIQALFQMCCCLRLMEKKTLNFKRQHQVTKSYFTPSWNYSNTSYHFKKNVYSCFSYRNTKIRNVALNTQKWN